MSNKRYKKVILSHKKNKTMHRSFCRNVKFYNCYFSNNVMNLHLIAIRNTTFNSNPVKLRIPAVMIRVVTILPNSSIRLI